MKTITLLTIFLFALQSHITLAAETEGSNSNSILEPMRIDAMDGTSFQVDEIIKNGQNIAFIFWQTWCAVCKREAPEVVAASKKHGKKIRFFGVISGSDDDVDNAKVEKLSKKLGLPYPQIRDRDLSLTQRYDVKGTPTIVVIGENLSVKYNSHKLPKDWSSFYPESPRNVTQN